MFVAIHHIMLSMIPIYEAHHIHTGKDIVVVTLTISSKRSRGCVVEIYLGNKTENADLGLRLVL